MHGTINWTTIIIALAAGYGALLSTINLIFYLLSNKKKVEVKFNWGIGKDPEDMRVKKTLGIEAVNKGKRVTMTQCYIKLPDNYNLFSMRSIECTTFPYDLEREKNMSFTFVVHEIIKTLLDREYPDNTYLYGVYKDAVGKEYFTDPITVSELYKNAK